MTSSTRQTAQGGRRRFYRRSAAGALAFFPWGLVPLLFLLLVFAAALTVGAERWVEHRTERAVKAALEREALLWVRVEVRGQGVVLSGTPTAEGLADRALDVAARATGPTWAGALVPARSVVAEFSRPEPEPPPPAPAPAGPCNFVFRRSEGVLQLQGHLPSEEARAEVVTLARSMVGQGAPALREVKDELTIDDSAAPSGAKVAKRGLRVLANCSEGRFEAHDGVISARCALAAEALSATDSLVRTPIEDYRLGAIELLASERIDACEARLAEVLSRSVVEFATASATIRKRSFGVIDEVAAAARDCPGTLEIGGHTDAQGEAEANRVLSRARAKSVLDALVKRGLSQDRLRAKGYGEAAPIADNSTRAGRQKNRRIQVRVLRN